MVALYRLPTTCLPLLALRDCGVICARRNDPGFSNLVKHGWARADAHGPAVRSARPGMVDYRPTAAGLDYLRHKLSI